MMKTHITALAVVSLFCLSGCERQRVPDWLVGNWIFDGEETRNALQAGSSDAENVVKTMQSGLYGLAFAMLEGMKIQIDQEYVVVSMLGKRTANPFDVFEVTPEVCTFIQSDGVLIDYHKTPNGFWRTSDDGKLRMYFKRDQSE